MCPLFVEMAHKGSVHACCAFTNTVSEGTTYCVFLQERRQSHCVSKNVTRANKGTYMWPTTDKDSRIDRVLPLQLHSPAGGEVGT